MGEQLAAHDGAPAVPLLDPASARLVSLDALRGFDMWWIIGGDQLLRSFVKASNRPAWQWIPDQLTHVPWEGFHFIDLIFPLFLFMIGVAIPFSLAKRLARGDSARRIHAHLFLRVAILIVLGMMVNGSLLTYDPQQFELSYSVLQMLALGYLVASLLFIHLRLRWQVLATVVMLVGYWALLAFVPGPGHEIGRFREGCNAGDWVTEFLVGRWRDHQVGWIIGILGHASTAMLGVFAGQMLRAPWGNARKVAALLALGCTCLALGYVWSGWFIQHLAARGIGNRFVDWPIWFPIIKNRWTSSFALYAGGWSYLLLALFYLVIDVWKVRRWAFPFIVIGANSIFAYMCWQLGSGVFRSAAGVFLRGLEQYVGPAWYEPIAWAGATAALWLLLWYLHRNKTLIRV
jgi:predicted acyltransferase